MTSTALIGFGPLVNTSTSAQFTIEDPWSVRGRLGYAQPNWMVYGTGGYAQTELNFIGNLKCAPPTCGGALSGPASFSTSRSGWVAGGGVEFKPFAAPWIAGLEYLYYRFDGTTNVTGAWSISPAVVNYSVGSFDLQTVRFRLSYKFGN